MSLVLALAALTTTEPAPYCPQVLDLAVSLQILDPRETRYVCVREEDWATDLALLRQRYQDLQAAPRLEEAEVLPPRELVNEWLTFNRCYRCYLEGRMELDLVHQWELRQIVVRCDAMYHTLDLIRDAQCEFYYVTVRRSALRHLVDKYRALELVPLNFVPLEYFQEIP